jgi:hypothetical protein
LCACGDDDASSDADRPRDSGLSSDDAATSSPDAGGAEPDAGGAHPAAGPVVEQLISPELMPISERAVYTDDGRFFVAGGEVLYEVEATDDGFEAVELLHEDCVLGGLIDHGNLLYAACVTTGESANPLMPNITGVELLRIDPSGEGEPEVQRVEFGADPLPQLNGMEFGPDDALYISNSTSGLNGGPAVYRVAITDEDPFSIEVSEFVAQSADYSVPNGLRFDGNEFYFATGLTLVRMQVGDDGTPGAPETLFTAGADVLTGGVVDDFDLGPDRIYIARVAGPDVLAVMGGNAVGEYQSQLVITDRDGAEIQTLALDFVPSGAVAPRAEPFGEDAIVVTSYFNGGLYRVTGAD